MKAILFATAVALANAASLTYTSGPVRSPPHPELSVRGTAGEPQGISRFEETVHQEAGDALGNREGGFVSRDSDGNVRTVRYSTEPRRAYVGHQQQRQSVQGFSASAPARYGSYNSQEGPFSYRHGSLPRSHTVTFTAPLGHSYSFYPQYPFEGNVRRYF